MYELGVRDDSRKYGNMVIGLPLDRPVPGQLSLGPQYAKEALPQCARLLGAKYVVGGREPLFCP